MLVLAGCGPKLALSDADATSGDEVSGGSALSGVSGDASSSDGSDPDTGGEPTTTAGDSDQDSGSEDGGEPCEDIPAPELHAFSFAPGFRAADVLVADLNADGRPELLLADPSLGAVGVIDGLAPLDVDSIVVMPAYGPTFALAAGDLDANAALDLVVAHSNGRIEVQLGDGSGALAFAATVEVADVLLDVAVGDLDGDGVLDAIALGSENQEGRVWWLRGLGDGALDAAASLVPGDWPRAYTTNLAVFSDATRPGASAVAAQLWDNDQHWIAVLRPGVDPDLSLELPYSATGIGAGDLGVDDVDDVVALGTETGELWRWSGLRGGGFADAESFPGRGFGTRLAVGDLDGAGGIDLIAGYGVEPVLERVLTRCDASLHREWLSVVLGTDSVHVIATGDLDTDDIDDIVVVDGPFASQTVTVLLTAER